MATYTQTITLSAPQWDSSTWCIPKEMFLCKEEQQLALAIILQLGSILTSHVQEKDLFSLNLMMAGKGLMTYVAANIKKPIEEFIQGGAEKMSSLLALLQDPENPGLLINPWLVENAMTLGEKNAKELQQFAARFDGRQIQAIPHEFAREIIGWIHTLKSKSEPLQHLAEASFPMMGYASGSSGSPESSSELLDYRRYTKYLSLLQQTQLLQETTEQNRLKLQAKEGEIQQLKATNVQLHLANRQMFERFEGLLDLQTKSNREQNTEIGHILDAQAKRQDETEALHKQIYGAAIQRIGSLQGSVVKAEAQIDTQKQRILSLCAQINACYEELSKKKEPSCNIL